MIIKRNERKRGNARRIIIILSWGFPSARASLFLSLCIHLPLNFPSPFITPHPPLPSFPYLCTLSPHRRSSSTEPAAPLFTPTNGGSFCFTFILISDEREDFREWPRYASATAAARVAARESRILLLNLPRANASTREGENLWRLKYLRYFYCSDCLAIRRDLSHSESLRLVTCLNDSSVCIHRISR